MKRRTLLAAALSAHTAFDRGWPFDVLSRRALAAPTQRPDAVTLLSAPIELAGEWGGSPSQAVTRVLSRTRQVCLSGVQLLSDQQPEQIRVDDHISGSPAVWLHPDGTRMAWIIVDIGARDWCKLAYQFGHELGHVLCNSWGHEAKPAPPCQWLEEALVESFSLRGLALLAESWAQEPPFPGDAAFAGAISQYRADLLQRYSEYATAQAAVGDMQGWFRAQREFLEQSVGLTTVAEAAVPMLLPELAGDSACVADMGALNRWPGRTDMPLTDYLGHWEVSCVEIGAAGRLPRWVRGMLVDT